MAAGEAAAPTSGVAPQSTTPAVAKHRTATELAAVTMTVRGGRGALAPSRQRPSPPKASRPGLHTVRCFSFEAPFFASMAAWAAASRAIGTRNGEQLT